MTGEIVANLESVQLRLPNRNFILGPISCGFEEGQITAIIGKNAGDKSMLLRILAGEISPHKGSVSYPAISPDKLDWPKVKEFVQHVPAFDNYFGYFGETVRDSIIASGAKYRLPKDEIEQKADELIERFELVEETRCDWSELSDGKKHRVALARTFMAICRLLLFDEPLANLDFISRRIILSQILELTQTQKPRPTVIIASQDIHSIETVADQVIVLDKGFPLHADKKIEISKKENWSLFEIGTLLNASDIQRYFFDLIPDDAKTITNSTILYFGRKVHPREVLTRLLAQDINFHFFRDISNSSQGYLEGYGTRTRRP